MSKLAKCDVCSKFITPASFSAGWGLQTLIHGEGRPRYSLPVQAMLANTLVELGLGAA